MQKINIHVTGMHCHSCEVIIEKSLIKLSGVSKVIAKQNKWTIEIFFEWQEPDLQKIEEIIKQNWYSLWIGGKIPWLSHNIDDYLHIWITLLILLIIYLIFQLSGISIWNIWDITTPTLWVAFLVWLTAWISSCMALVWWLILWISANWNQWKENDSRWSKFQPHLYFNLGRVLWFWFLGWLLGLFGSFISMSNIFLWSMTVFVWIIMLLLGLNLTHISPKLWNISITLPKFLWKNIWNNNSSSKKWAFITGILSFFLPCWFTLAMQMYAISTGSFFLWSFILWLFALGTVPWLIWIWVLTSFLKWAWAKRFFTFTGTIVLLLWFFNLTNWYNLLSLWIPSWNINIKQNIDTSNLWNQEIRMTQDENWYSPNTFNIQPNTKIKLIVTSTNPYSCASQLMIPKLWITKSLQQWENTIEFISPASWEIKFSCSMWMYNWKFIIDEKTWNNPNANIIPQAINNNQWWWIKGCWWWGWVNTPTKNITSEKNTSVWDSKIQTIHLTYTSVWLSSNISIKKWTQYKIIIDVKDTISGCMGTIYIPWLDENIQKLEAGTEVIFNITPTTIWQFPFTCAMGVPHWYINVE